MIIAKEKSIKKMTQNLSILDSLKTIFSTKDYGREMAKKHMKVINVHEYSEIEVSKIFPNLFQQRKDFNQKKLDKLKESIKKYGIIQPIAVREVANGYEVVAGQRRLKAVKELGIKKIPAVIKSFSNEKSLEIALVENIQREDLNPIEQANAFKRLIDEFKLTQQELAEVIGKSGTLVANTIGLLKLNVNIQKDIIEGKVSFGHAKLLLGIEDEKLQNEICNRVISNNLSVRETKRLIENIAGGAPKKFPGLFNNFDLERQ